MKASLTALALLLAATTLPAQVEVHGSTAGEMLGAALAVVGDLDGDGVPDLALGAPDANSPLLDVGALRVVSGADGSALFSITGFGALDDLGAAVAGIGDIDGDAVPDLVVGAPQDSKDTMGGSSPAGLGYVVVVSGSDGSVIRVLQADRYTNIGYGGYYGSAVTGMGDVDGDGVPDFVVGEYDGDLEGHSIGSTSPGRVHVLSGADGGPIREHVGVVDVNAWDLGRSVAGVGDLTGDGIDDLAVGTPVQIGFNQGRVYLYSGATGALVWDFSDADTGHYGGMRVAPAGDVDGDGTPDVLVSGSDRVTVLSGVDGTMIDLVMTSNLVKQGGPSAASLGDINDDGYADYAIGDPLHDTPSAGAAGFVRLYSGKEGFQFGDIHGDQDGELFGASLALLDLPGGPALVIGAPGHDGPAGIDAGRVVVVDPGATGTQLPMVFPPTGTTSGSGFGFAAAFAGDVDNDGWDDVIVGAPFEATAGPDTGRVQVFSGRNGLLLHDLIGPADAGRLGWAVARAGDIDQDGFADVLASEPSAVNPPSPGRVFAWSGRDGTLLLELAGVSTSDNFGWDVDGDGDADGDGVPDVLVGAPFDDLAGLSFGAARVFSGADGTQLLQVLGDESGADFGSAVAFVGDLDADGLDDIGVGARLDDSSAGVNVGRVRVYSSADGSVLLDAEGTTAFERFGTALVGVGDTNGDGVPDVLVGDPRYDGSQVDIGRGVVLSGADGTELLSMEGLIASGWTGSTVAAMGDLTGDGVSEVVLGARTAGYPDADHGHVDIRDGVSGEILFSADGTGPFDGYTDAVDGGGDLDNDGRPDLIVGTTDASFVGAPEGAVIFFQFQHSNSSWKSQGALLPGGAHAPKLVGSGSMLPGDAVTLATTGALPLAPVTLVVGVSALSAPLKGGVMVPDPLLLIGPLATDALGALSLGGTLPGITPSGFTLYAQTWIVDPAGPLGYAASNAVEGTTP